MQKLQEADSPWDRGYTLACMKNVIKTPFRTKEAYSKAGKYLHMIRVEKDFSVVPNLVKEISHYKFFREFFRDTVIVPLPPSKEREIQPVQFMAEELGKFLSVEVNSEIFPVLIVDETSPIPKAERNKTRRFEMRFVPSEAELSKYDKIQKLVLFDDYYDTGRTMKDAVKALNEEGFYNIDIFTVCCTQAAKRRIKKV